MLENRLGLSNPLLGKEDGWRWMWNSVTPSEISIAANLAIKAIMHGKCC
jgi:hypothetical protein